MNRVCRQCTRTNEEVFTEGLTWLEDSLCSKCADLIDDAHEEEDDIEDHGDLEDEESDEADGEEKDKTRHTEPSKEWRSGPERLLAEHSTIKGGGKEGAIARPVLDTLIMFCKNDRFSEAVRTSTGTFGECLKKVLQGVGSSISDLEVYQRAAAFYFPNAKISFNMSIDLNGASNQAGEKQDHKRVDINLDDLF